MRLPGSWTGLAGKIADTFNSIVSANQQMADELKRAVWTKLWEKRVGRANAPRFHEGPVEHGATWRLLDQYAG